MPTTKQQIAIIDALLDEWSDIPAIANPLWEKRRELTNAQSESDSRPAGTTDTDQGSSSKNGSPQGHGLESDSVGTTEVMEAEQQASC